MKKIVSAIMLCMFLGLLTGCGLTTDDDKVYDIFYYKEVNGYAEVYKLTDDGLKRTFIDFPTEINGLPVKLGSVVSLFFTDSHKSIESEKLEVIIVRRGITILWGAFSKSPNLKYVILLDDEKIEIEGPFEIDAEVIVVESLLEIYQKSHPVYFTASKAAFYDGNELYFLSYDDEDHVKEPETPTKEGYTFIGWSQTSSADNLYDFTNPAPTSKSITLYAVWTNNE